MHVFQDKDGCNFVLLPDVWKHIIEGHPEMEKHLKEVGHTLLQPNLICKSKKFDHCFLYYRAFRKKLFVAVVVDTLKNIVKTSYITDRIKEGQIVWQEKK